MYHCPSKFPRVVAGGAHHVAWSPIDKTLHRARFRLLCRRRWPSTLVFTCPLRRRRRCPHSSCLPSLYQGPKNCAATMHRAKIPSINRHPSCSREPWSLKKIHFLCKSLFVSPITKFLTLPSAPIQPVFPLPFDVRRHKCGWDQWADRENRRMCLGWL